MVNLFHTTHTPSRKFERKTLWFLLIFGILSFLNLVRKPPMKEWVLIFLLKGYISSILDKITVKKGYIKYPVRLVKVFDVSFIFDYLLFPIACVYYNQITYNSKLFGLFFKVFWLVVPMTIIENWLERNTQLVSYKKGWNWVKTFLSLTMTFWLVRGIMMIIRKFSFSDDASDINNKSSNHKVEI